MNLRKAVRLLILGAAIPIAAWCFVSFDGGGTPRVANAASPRPHAAVHAIGAPAVEEHSLQPSAVSIAPTAERALGSASDEGALFGRVIGPRGEPIAGATISWTPLPDPALDADALERATSATVVDATTSWTSSDSAGQFELDLREASDRSEHAVIWLTHPDRESVPVVLSGEREQWPSLASLVMKPAHGVEVEVVTESAGGVEGASVEQRGWVEAAIERAPKGSRPARANAIDALARRVFHRRVTTGRDGWTKLFPYAGPTWIRARRDALASEPKVVQAVERTTLRLRATFTVRGRVLDLEAVAGAGASPQIVCSAQSGNVVRALDTLDVGEGARFGPVSLPVLDGMGYRFELRGEGLARKATLVSLPQPGEIVRVDFVAEAGHDVWFLIVDSEEKRLPEAEAIVHWNAAGIELEARAKARPDGFTVVRGVPSGTIVGEARCPGYRATSLEPESLPEPERTTRGVVLADAGRLTGKCLHHGEPVRDFEIAIWPTKNSFDVVRHVFVDREDGSFEIHDAPLGTVCVLASGAALPPAQVARAEIGVNEAPHLVFTLPDPIRGRGRVVDQATGAAVPEARVTLYSSDGFDVIASLGPASTVRADGSFEVDGFAPGRTVCTVSAPGYATTRVAVQATEHGGVDIGVIRLVRKQALEIRLSMEKGADAGDYTASLTGADVVPRTRFGADGTLRIAELSPGSYELHVERQGELVYGAYPVLETGQRWRIDVPLATEHTLAITVRSDDERVASGTLGAVVSFRGADDAQVERYVAIASDGTATCTGIPAGDVSVGVFASDREILATVHTVVRADEREHSVVIELGDDVNVFLLRVVDALGAPISNARVQLAPVGRGGAWSEEQSDDQGMVAFRGLEPGQYLAHLFHQTFGWRLGVEIEVFDGEREPIVIELDAQARIEVLLAGNGDPQAGVRVTLYDVHKSIAFASIRSNEVGIARLENLALGLYVLVVDEPGYFPTEAWVESMTDHPSTRVAVRRTGDIELELSSTKGVPLAGVPVELFAASTGQDVAPWCAQGKVQVSSPTMTTDARGSLTFKGLPHGSYTWRVKRPEGLMLGDVVVRAATMVKVPVVLP